MSQRCQWAADTPTFQCVLDDGHEGEHIHKHQLEEARRRERAPTLEDIRRVVREEIRSAEAERRNAFDRAVLESIRRDRYGSTSQE